MGRKVRRNLLSPERTIGTRLVRQTVGSPDAYGTNLYLAFSQRVRSGSDLFIVFGDPNSPRTRGKATVKVVSLL